jgi:hypothetical protein
MIKVYYMYVWKCHTEIPYFVQLIYTNKKKKICPRYSNISQNNMSQILIFIIPVFISPISKWYNNQPSYVSQKFGYYTWPLPLLPWPGSPVRFAFPTLLSPFLFCLHYCSS